MRLQPKLSRSFSRKVRLHRTKKQRRVTSLEHLQQIRRRKQHRNPLLLWHPLLHQPHLLNLQLLLHLLRKSLVQLQKLSTVHRQRCQTTYSKRLWMTVQHLRRHRVRTVQQSSLHHRRKVQPARQTVQSLRRQMQQQRHLPHLLPILRQKALIHRWSRSWFQP